MQYRCELSWAAQKRAGSPVTQPLSGSVWPRRLAFLSFVLRGILSHQIRLQLRKLQACLHFVFVRAGGPHSSAPIPGRLLPTPAALSEPFTRCCGASLTPFPPPPRPFVFLSKRSLFRKCPQAGVERLSLKSASRPHEAAGASARGSGPALEPLLRPELSRACFGVTGCKPNTVLKTQNLLCEGH